jgi:hypothetical protein
MQGKVGKGAPGMEVGFLILDSGLEAVQTRYTKLLCACGFFFPLNLGMERRVYWTGSLGTTELDTTSSTFILF